MWSKAFLLLAFASFFLNTLTYPAISPFSNSLSLPILKARQNSNTRQSTNARQNNNNVLAGQNAATGQDSGLARNRNSAGNRDSSGGADGTNSQSTNAGGNNLAGQNTVNGQNRDFAGSAGNNNAAQNSNAGGNNLAGQDTVGGQNSNSAGGSNPAGNTNAAGNTLPAGNTNSGGTTDSAQNRSSTEGTTSGSYSAPGLKVGDCPSPEAAAARKKELAKLTGWKPMYLAIAMSENSCKMNADYPLGDVYPNGTQKTGDAANFGMFKNNWAVIKKYCSYFSSTAPEDWEAGKYLNDHDQEAVTCLGEQLTGAGGQWYALQRGIPDQADDLNNVYETVEKWLVSEGGVHLTDGKIGSVDLGGV